MLNKLKMATAMVSHRAGSRRWSTPLVLLGVAVCCALLPTMAQASSAPSIGAISGSGSENYATFQVPIEPNGLETKYEVWLQCTKGSCASTEGHRVADGSIEAGRLEQQVSVALTSLEWDTEYRLEVSASNKDGTVSSHPQTFTTSSPPPAGAPGGTGGGKPVEGKLEQWVIEGAEREAKEAPRIRAEEEVKKREEEERPAKEAAACAAKERESREAGERAGREAAERELLAKQRSAVVCRVPSLKGDSLTAARHALTKAHCRLGRVSRPAHRGSALVVVRQSIRRGTKLRDRAAVAIILGAARR